MGDTLYNDEHYKELLESKLSKKRYIHCCNVALSAQRLAVLYGADSDKAYVAGLLHDICKEMPADEQKLLAVSSGYSLSEEELSSRQLWHAVAGACYIRRNLHIEDDELLASVRYHTIGHAAMSPLEETVYLADLVSEDRKYKDVARIRKLAFTDKNAALFEALRFSLSNVAEKGVPIPITSVEAYNFYLKRCEEQKTTENL